jgi:hypothetical protein
LVRGLRLLDIPFGKLRNHGQKSVEPGMLVHACNPSTWKAEARRIESSIPAHVT